METVGLSFVVTFLKARKMKKNFVNNVNNV